MLWLNSQRPLIKKVLQNQAGKKADVERRRRKSLHEWDFFGIFFFFFFWFWCFLSIERARALVQAISVRESCSILYGERVSILYIIKTNGLQGIITLHDVTKQFCTPKRHKQIVV